MNITLGPFTIAAEATEPILTDGETVSGAPSTGRGSLYKVLGPDGLELTVRDITWDTGERDLAVFRRHGSPERFDTLVERLRLTVLDYNGPYVELRHVKLRDNGRGGLFDADADALANAAGIDVVDVLRSLGASAVGTREGLLGDDGRTRRRWGARFPPGNNKVPLAAFVLTRVAPVLRRS